MFTKRRLIAMIRGRAQVGGANPGVPLAARPQLVTVLRRATVAVGGAGLVCALATASGGPLLRQAASTAAAVGAGPHPRSVAASESAPADAAPGVIALGDPSVNAPVAALPTSAPATPAQIEAPAEVAAQAEVARPSSPVPLATTSSTSTVPSLPAPPAPGTVEAIIHEVFGGHGRAAVAVARCESGLNPRAVSAGGGNWGLFQINRVHRRRVARMGYQWEDLLDARVNAQVARSIFDEQGWRPWACRRAI